MMMKKYDEVYSEKPMKRFLMANEHDIHRVEKLLFGFSHAGCFWKYDFVIALKLRKLKKFSLDSSLKNDIKYIVNKYYQ